MPPSLATSQYPSFVLVPAIPTIGRARNFPPIDPSKAASPKLKMPPSLATIQ
jgi:hypothetical protein